MILDIHNHTYYSGCGKDHPEKLISAAIEGGIEVFGISDHNYGIDDRKDNYVNQLRQLAEKYKDKITLLCGMEISTSPHQMIPEDWDCSEFDYCLLEDLQNKDSVVTDIAEFSKRFKCRVGIAHTDLFEYCALRGYDPAAFFKELGNVGVFWEMNINYDSIHRWREHEYVKRLFASPEQQDIIRSSGIELSVGFDGHRIEDYNPKRSVDACRRIEELGIKLVDFN